MKTPLCFAFASLTAALSAQDLSKARSYYPDQHSSFVTVDVKRALDTGLFDTIERTPARLAMEMFRRSFGFGLDNLSRWTHLGRIHTEQDENGFHQRDSVMVFEGNDKVSFAKTKFEDLGYEIQPDQIGDTPIHRNNSQIYASLRPGLCVIGNTTFLAGILEGKTRGGVPHMDLIQLMAGKRPLVQVAGLKPSELEPLDMDPIPREWMTEEDLPKAVLIRLDERKADRHLVLTFRVSFEYNKLGPEHFAASAKKFVVDMQENPEALPFKKLMNDVAITADDRGALLTLDLGQEGKDLLGYANVMTLAMTIFGTSAEPQIIKAQALVPVEVIAQDVEVGAVKKKVTKKPTKKN